MEYSVSVVIPNYNRNAEFISSLDSVLAQSLQPTEIIVVDDHSTFDVKNLLFEKGYLTDNRIKVIRNKVNRGCAGSRNVGIENASGNLIALLDSDDFWHVDKLKKQTQLFIENPELDMVYCDTWVVDSGRTKPSRKELVDTDIWTRIVVDGWTPPNPSTLLIKKSAMQAVNMFDPNLKHNEDLDFWMRLLDHNMKVSYCPEALSYFNFDSGNRLSKSYKEKFARADVFLAKWRQFFMHKNNLPVFEKFKTKTITRYAIETFVNSIKNRDVWTSMEVYLKYLWNRSDFYTIIYNKVTRNYPDVR